MRRHVTIGMALLTGAIAIALVFVGAAFFEDSAEASSKAPRQAEALIAGCVDGSITGSARLIEEITEEGIKVVRVLMRVRGLPAGKHGVHIHETATCTPCGAAGGHFDPGPVGLTSPDGNHPFHMGDLVNINVRNNGTGILHAVTTRVTLSDGPLSIFDTDGSAFIIHVQEDTFCPGGVEAGCAGGGRAACGIIMPRD